jgi:hypothetical protein
MLVEEALDGRGADFVVVPARYVPSGYANLPLFNVIEQDHRNVKFRTNAMLGFKRFRNAATTLASIELMHRIRAAIWPEPPAPQRYHHPRRLECGHRCSMRNPDLLEPARRYYLFAPEPARRRERKRRVGSQIPHLDLLPSQAAAASSFYAFLHESELYRARNASTVDVISVTLNRLFRR